MSIYNLDLLLESSNMDEVSLLSEQVLAEMNISKKDMQNPDKIKAILEKGFPTPLKCVLFCLNALTVIIGAVLTPFTVGLSIFIMIYILACISEIPDKHKKKVTVKVKDKLSKYKNKLSIELKKNPSNSKAKEALSKVNESIKAIEKIEKEEISEKWLNEVEYAKTIYNKMIKWWKKPYLLGDGDDSQILYLAVMIFGEIPVAQVCYNSINRKESKEDLINDWGEKIANKIAKMLNSDNITPILINDDYMVICSNKKIIEISTNYAKEYKVNHSKTYDNGIISNKAYYQADKDLGYYKFADQLNIPKGVTPIETDW